MGFASAGEPAPFIYCSYKKQSVTSANAALWEVPQDCIYAVGRYSVEAFHKMGHMRNMYPSSRMLGC